MTVVACASETSWRYARPDSASAKALVFGNWRANRRSPPHRPAGRDGRTALAKVGHATHASGLELVTRSAPARVCAAEPVALALGLPRDGSVASPIAAVERRELLVEAASPSPGSRRVGPDGRSPWPSLSDHVLELQRPGRTAIRRRARAWRSPTSHGRTEGGPAANTAPATAIGRRSITDIVSNMATPVTLRSAGVTRAVTANRLERCVGRTSVRSDVEAAPEAEQRRDDRRAGHPATATMKPATITSPLVR